MFKSASFLILFAMSSAYCNVTSICSQTEMSDSYLDVAINMILKAKDNIPTCPVNQLPKAADCADVLQMGHKKSGVYEVWPINRVTEGKPIIVYCDMDTDGGGWTVIQRRGDFQAAKDYFHQGWESYKEGFGDAEKDFWLGNDNILALTNQKLYSARFDMKDVEQNKKYAFYEKFWIDDEINKYTLHISGYRGDAGDSLEYHNNQKFSAEDQDNDNDKLANCAEIAKGAWWYNACHHSNLNGLYHKGKHTDMYGVSWKSWKGIRESLEWTEIKVRPKKFRPSYLTLATPM